MNIDGLGEKIIEQLIGAGHVKDFADLYRLREEHISELVRDVQIGEKKATDIVESINALRPTWAEVTASLGSRTKESLSEQLQWLAKRHGIKGLGEKTIEYLVEAKMVKNVDDLLELEVEKIAELTHEAKVGPKSAAEILKNIETSKSKGLARVLSGLGIRLVGTTVSNEFANWAGNIQKLREATLEDLAAVLSKNPDAQREAERKEREYASSLFAALHDSSDHSLFEPVKRSNAAPTEAATEAFLVKRDEGLPRGSKFGKSRIQKLAECFPDFVELEAATADEIADCLLEGRAVARSFYDYLHSDRGDRTLKDLASVGVKLEAESVKIEQSEWTGKTVVITGSFDMVSRDKLKERLMTLGAKVGESVSSKTHAVFVGTDPGSKYDKAVSLKVPIFREDKVKQIMQP